MNGKKVKELRKTALDFAVEWLKTMVSPEEAEKITPQAVLKFESNQDRYVYGNGTRQLSAYSTKYFLRKLKKAYKNNTKPDFTIRSLQELERLDG